MWQKIANELQDVVGVIVTPNHCENRWKVLDRNYKKYVDNQSSTGRGKNISNIMKICKLFLG